MLRLFELTGRGIFKRFVDAGHGVVLWGRTLSAALRSAPFQLRAIAGQLYICAAESLFVCLIVGTFTGMILALQTGFVLRQYHIEGFIGTVILVTLLKELGPFMCAFILAGRVGSAMAAELGTMSVSEEIDALEVMSIDPVRYLVVPRFLALTLASPILTIYVNVIGVIGGSVVAKYQIGVPYDIYYRRIWEYLEGAKLSLIYGGLAKALVFGMLISIVGCSKGLRATHGAEGVGEASRQSVVDSFLLVLIFNYFMSSIINRYL